MQLFARDASATVIDVPLENAQNAFCVNCVNLFSFVNNIIDVLLFRNILNKQHSITASTG